MPEADPRLTRARERTLSGFGRDTEVFSFGATV